jgi:electron transport complex protein RnfC
MSPANALPKDFRGGLHLDGHKGLSNGRPIAQPPLPKELVLPLQQHIGEAAEADVKVGDQVAKGQVIARPTDYISAFVHAPTSGKVVAIEPRPVPHPSGLSSLCIVLQTDGKDAWADLPRPLTHFSDCDPVELRERIRWAGVVGLGGAGFPTSVKANPGTDLAVETLIINGAECEPYITCDDRLMRERAEQVITGAAIVQHLIGANECIIGIEDDKPEAIAALHQAISALHTSAIRVGEVRTKYPSGGEKQLIYLLTGKIVPSHAIPAEIGILCQNVGTTVAVADAVLRGRPLISRIITVTGDGVARPQNFEVLMGSSAAHLIAAAGGYTARAQRLIFGGSMMGFALPHDGVPVTKVANCLLVASAQQAPPAPAAGPCIRCGECARVCPVQLLPQQLYWYARSKNLDKVQDYAVFDCIECGCCAHVCPAHIPLVQYYRFAKTEIWAQERERRKADIARQRHEARTERLARLQAERKARLRKQRDDLEGRGSHATTPDAKRAAIAAAMQRVAAKKAARSGAAEPQHARQIDETT